MRVAVPFVTLIAGAYALTQPVARRDTLDVCAYVDADLKLANPLTGSPLVFGHLDLCLCVSGIPAILKANIIVIAAVDLLGTSKVQAALNTLVTTASNSKHCTYPDHCDPICSAQHPCGWQCHDGFTPSPSDEPTECVCKYPNHICNGVCTSSACPSSAPKKRSINDLKKRALCDAGFTACGVYNGLIKGSTKHLFECVDATSDLESCGGCSVPLHEKSPLGVDCTALPGVSDVSCSSGTCIVHRCMPGYEIAYDHSMCVDIRAFEKFIPASDYGLEHLPFDF